MTTQTTTLPSTTTKRHHRAGCGRQGSLPNTKRWEHVTCGTCRRKRSKRVGA